MYLGAAHAAHSEYNRSIAVQDAIKDGSPSGKRKLDEALSDKEQADGEAQKKGSMGPVASPEAVNSTGVVGGEEN